MGKPKVTAIIPVFNVEDYLRDTIESVVSQDIGFEDNIEIILVNDGSPDNSEAICRDYVNRYPDNVKYIYQDNSGVSQARNNGLKHATGDYIHFLDSDDIISNNAYSEAIKLLNDSGDKIDFVALRIEFFDATYGSHPLNYKFSGNRVIDVDLEPSAIIMHMPTCIIRRVSINTEFVRGIEISEDSRFISEILAQKKSYGVVSSGTYYYRKRSTRESAIDTAREKKSYYNITPSEVYEHILNIWSDSSGTPHPYAQNLVAYELQWRIRQRKQGVLSNREEVEYKEKIYSIAKRIDSDIILSQRSIGVAEKEFLLEAKGEGRKSTAREALRGEYVAGKRFIVIDLIEFYKDKMTIIGHVPSGASFTDLIIKFADEIINPTKLKMYYRQNEFIGDIIYDGGGFSFDLPYTSSSEEILFLDNDIVCDIVTKKHSRLPDVSNSYVNHSEITVINKKRKLLVRPRTATNHFLRELLWLSRILVGLKLRYAAKEMYRISRVTIKHKMPLSQLARPVLIPVKALLFNIRDILIRLIFYVYRFTKNRPVWIVSDKIASAGDNGEAFFEYLVNNAQASNKYDIYFAIDVESSVEYDRICSIGRVVNRQGFRYKLLFLCADKIISSHAEDAVYNAFGDRFSSFVDLYKFDFVFLQHGIIKDDLSSWLNKYAKNIRLFVTSTTDEYRSIIDGNYSYDKNRVILTGLPRYDRLRDKSDKVLVIMPTWRAGLVPSMNQKTGQRESSKSFKGSEFFLFYNKLINDAQLNEVLKDHGYRAEFYLHPSFASQISDFDSTEMIEVMPFPHDYQDAFSRGRIMLTDYSSVAFDFGYMNKPLAYVQVDEKSFFENQVYSKGYFSYHKNGLGPVLGNYDEAVKWLVHQIELDGSADAKYIKRIKSFFNYSDRNNSKRVYNQIVKIGPYEKDIYIS